MAGGRQERNFDFHTGPRVRRPTRTKTTPQRPPRAADVPRDRCARVARAEELVARSRGHPEEPRARELLAEAKAELARQEAPSPAAKVAPAATPPASPPLRREAPASPRGAGHAGRAAPVRHHRRRPPPAPAAPARRPGGAARRRRPRPRRPPPAARPGSAYWAQRAADAPPPPPAAPPTPTPPVPPPAEPQYRSDTPTRQTLATVRDATAPPPQAPPRAWATGAAAARDTSRTPRPPSYAGTSRTPPRGVAESKSSEPGGRGDDFLADMREAASPASAPARARGAARVWRRRVRRRPRRRRCGRRRGAARAGRRPAPGAVPPNAADAAAARHGRGADARGRPRPGATGPRRDARPRKGRATRTWTPSSPATLCSRAPGRRRPAAPLTASEKSASAGPLGVSGLRARKWYELAV